MKNTDRDLQKNNNTLLYIFFLLLLVVVVGDIVYYVNKSKVENLSKSISWINDTSGLNNNQSFTNKDIANKIEIVNIKKKKICEKIILNNELNAKEKKEYKNVWEDIFSNKVLELNEWKLMKIKEDKKKQNIIFQVLKEVQRLDRLEIKIDKEIPERTAKFWNQDQPNWQKKIFPNEEEEVKKKINETFTPFFYKFREELISKGEEKSVIEKIKPRLINGEPTIPANLQKHINYLKTQTYNIIDEKTDSYRLVTPGPLEWKFLGFTGFLGLEKEVKKEGIILGITNCRSKNIFPKKEKGIKKYFLVGFGPANIEIKLKRELLFSRLGRNYDRWISSFEKTKSGPQKSTCYDISWEMLMETIAHELAHAVIESVRWKYKDWDNGGGHGPLHTDYTKRIRKMIESSPECEKFEQWWKKKW